MDAFAIYLTPTYAMRILFSTKYYITGTTHRIWIFSLAHALPKLAPTTQQTMLESDSGIRCELPHLLSSFPAARPPKASFTNV